MYKHLLFSLISLCCFSCIDQPVLAQSTALPNVHVLPQAFEMNGLDRERQIRVYLPESYTTTINKKYPVLYMHDGQNLFDNLTSYVGEWGVDESLNDLAKTGFEIIVVGIDNGQEKRVNELSPWEHEKYGKAEGKEYMDFIVNQIKPYIDSTYRTYPNRENTAIMGSSLGGLISHYAIFEYSEYFSKAGILSPSYWYADAVFDFSQQSPLPRHSRLYLAVGKKEEDMVDDANKMNQALLDYGHPKQNLHLFVDPEGDHNETSWRRQFIPAIRWLYSVQSNE